MHFKNFFVALLSLSIILPSERLFSDDQIGVETTARVAPTGEFPGLGYYAIIKGLPAGRILQLENPSNGKGIRAVIVDLPQNLDADLYLSNIAGEALGLASNEEASIRVKLVELSESDFSDKKMDDADQQKNEDEEGVVQEENQKKAEDDSAVRANDDSASLESETAKDLSGMSEGDEEDFSSRRVLFSNPMTSKKREQQEEPVAEVAAEAENEVEMLAEGEIASEETALDEIPFDDGDLPVEEEIVEEATAEVLRDESVATDEISEGAEKAVKESSLVETAQTRSSDENDLEEVIDSEAEASEDDSAVQTNDDSTSFENETVKDLSGMSEGDEEDFSSRRVLFSNPMTSKKREQQEEPVAEVAAEAETEVEMLAEEEIASEETVSDEIPFDDGDLPVEEEVETEVGGSPAETRFSDENDLEEVIDSEVEEKEFDSTSLENETVKDLSGMSEGNEEDFSSRRVLFSNPMTSKKREQQEEPVAEVAAEAENEVEMLAEGESVLDENLSVEEVSESEKFSSREKETQESSISDSEQSFVDEEEFASDEIPFDDGDLPAEEEVETEVGGSPAETRSSDENDLEEVIDSEVEASEDDSAVRANDDSASLENETAKDLSGMSEGDEEDFSSRRVLFSNPMTSKKREQQEAPVAEVAAEAENEVEMLAEGEIASEETVSDEIPFDDGDLPVEEEISESEKFSSREKEAQESSIKNGERSFSEEEIVEEAAVEVLREESVATDEISEGAEKAIKSRSSSDEIAQTRFSDENDLEEVIDSEVEEKEFDSTSFGSENAKDLSGMSEGDEEDFSSRRVLFSNPMTSKKREQQEAPVAEVAAEAETEVEMLAEEEIASEETALDEIPFDDGDLPAEEEIVEKVAAEVLRDESVATDEISEGAEKAIKSESSLVATAQTRFSDENDLEEVIDSEAEASEDDSAVRANDDSTSFESETAKDLSGMSEGDEEDFSSRRVLFSNPMTSKKREQQEELVAEVAAEAETEVEMLAEGEIASEETALDEILFDDGDLPAEEEIVEKAAAEVLRDESVATDEISEGAEKAIKESSLVATAQTRSSDENDLEEVIDSEAEASEDDSAVQTNDDSTSLENETAKDLSGMSEGDEEDFSSRRVLFSNPMTSKKREQQEEPVAEVAAEAETEVEMLAEEEIASEETALDEIPFDDGDLPAEEEVVEKAAVEVLQEESVATDEISEGAEKAIKSRSSSDEIAQTRFSDENDLEEVIDSEAEASEDDSAVQTNDDSTSFGSENAKDLSGMSEGDEEDSSSRRVLFSNPMTSKKRKQQEEPVAEVAAEAETEVEMLAEGESVLDENLSVEEVSESEKFSSREKEAQESSIENGERSFSEEEIVEEAAVEAMPDESVATDEISEGAEKAIKSRSSSDATAQTRSSDENDLEEVIDSEVEASEDDSAIQTNDDSASLENETTKDLSGMSEGDEEDFSSRRVLFSNPMTSKKREQQEAPVAEVAAEAETEVEMLAEGEIASEETVSDEIPFDDGDLPVEEEIVEEAAVEVLQEEGVATDEISEGAEKAVKSRSSSDEIAQTRFSDENDLEEVIDSEAEASEDDSAVQTNDDSTSLENETAKDLSGMSEGDEEEIVSDEIPFDDEDLPAEEEISESEKTASEKTIMPKMLPADNKDKFSAQGESLEEDSSVPVYSSKREMKSSKKEEASQNRSSFKDKENAQLNVSGKSEKSIAELSEVQSLPDSESDGSRKFKEEKKADSTIRSKQGEIDRSEEPSQKDSLQRVEERDLFSEKKPSQLDKSTGSKALEKEQTEVAENSDFTIALDLDLKANKVNQKGDAQSRIKEEGQPAGTESAQATEEKQEELVAFEKMTPILPEKKDDQIDSSQMVVLPLPEIPLHQIESEPSKGDLTESEKKDLNVKGGMPLVEEEDIEVELEELEKIEEEPLKEEKAAIPGVEKDELSSSVVENKLSAGLYYQIGAFRYLERAESMIDKVSEEMKELVVISRMGMKLYKVLIGPLNPDEKGFVEKSLQRVGIKGFFIEKGEEQ